MSITAYENEQDEQVSQALMGVQQVENSVSQLLAAIPNMTDQQLDACLVMTFSVEKAAFVIRGAVLVEKQRRSQPLVGGRGNSDDKGVGRKAIARETARELGKGASTLETDARIVETFEDDLYAVHPREGGEAVLNEDALPREFYAVALTLGDDDKAREAIKTAHKKRDEMGQAYTAKMFSQDVQLWRHGKTETDLYWLQNVALDTETRESLRKLTVAWGLDQSGVVRRALSEASLNGKSVDSLPKSDPIPLSLEDTQAVALADDLWKSLCQTADRRGCDREAVADKILRHELMRKR